MLSKQHVLVELNQFIQIVTSYKNEPSKLSSPSVVRNAIALLQELPASKEIVLDYFSSVVEIAIHNYVSNVNIDNQTGMPIHRDNGGNIHQLDDEINCFSQIQETLESFLNNGKTAWGPVLTAWCLEIVGRLSDLYTPRHMSIAAICSYWYNCPGMNGLLKIISICFRILNDDDIEPCVQSLLTLFQRYNVTFDWVVARLGSCFPFHIMTQILHASLKRFSDDMTCRFDSEVSILDYLASVQEKELRAALGGMLMDGIKPKKTLDNLIVPFLLNLMQYSDYVLQNLALAFLQIYEDDFEEAILRMSAIWMNNKVFVDMQPSLNNIALRLKMHGVTLLLGAAQLSEKYNWCQDFVEFSLEELDQTILSAQLCPLMEDLPVQQTKFMLWNAMLSTDYYIQQTAVRLLTISCAQHPQIYYQTITELLRKPQSSDNLAIGVIVRLLGGLSGLIDFPDIKPGFEMILEDVLLQVEFPNSRITMLRGFEEPQITFKNIISLVKALRKNNISLLKQQVVVLGLHECVPKILNILDVILMKIMLHIREEAAKHTEQKLKELETNNNNTITDFYMRRKKRLDTNAIEFEETEPGTSGACGDRLEEPNDDEDEIDEMDENIRHQRRVDFSHIIIDLLNIIETGSKSFALNTADIMKLAVLTVKYFFVSMTEKNMITRSKAINQALMLLQRQSLARKAARTVCLRELIEGALFYHGNLFGQAEDFNLDELAIPSNEMVLLQNQNQLAGPNTNRTVLHAGVIGRGLRYKLSNDIDDTYNAQMEKFLLSALDACCTDGVDRDTAGYSIISLLLVEMVSTDVMYNGLPFPEEDFTKVTMERDLMIHRAFFNSPVLWSLLGFIATHRPALCFSSVLMRALCATCLQQWRAKNVNKLQIQNPNEDLMFCTKNLLRLLAVGQLLPPPLSSLHVIIDYFEAPEIALILKECVWNYLKDNVPSPVLFHIDANGLHWRNPALAKIPPQYIDPLRNIMQKKLNILGSYYHQMFIMSELNNPVVGPPSTQQQPQPQQQQQTEQVQTAIQTPVVAALQTSVITNSNKINVNIDTNES